MTTSTTRLHANEAIDQFILGAEAGYWSHCYIDDEDVPYCDIANRRICSPVMPALIDPKIDQIVRGKNEHEAGHAKLTPFDKDKSWSPLKNHVINVLEDLRIERGLKAMSVAISDDLSAMNRHFIAKQQIGFQTGKYNGIKPVNEALTALHFNANGFPPEWSLSPEAQKYYDDAMPIFNEWQNADCSSKSGFSKIEKIADRIVARWEKSREEMNQQSQNGNGGNGNNQDQKDDSQSQNGTGQDSQNHSQNQSQSQSGNGDDNQSQSGNSQKKENGQNGKEGQGNGNQSENDENSQSQNGQNGENGRQSQSNHEDDGRQDGKSGNGGVDDQNDTKNPEETENSKSVSKKHKNPQGSSGNEGKTLEDDFVDNDNEAEAIKEELQKVFEESKKVFGNYKPYTAEDQLLCAKEDKDQFESAFSEIRGATAMLSSYLGQSLKTLSRSRVLNNRDRGFLNVNHNATNICKSLTKNLFSKKVKGISLDTTVSILIDESGSIGYDTSREFRKIVIAFAEVLERLGIKFEVLGHTNGWSRHCPLNAGFTRRSRMVMFEHKNFNEPYRSERYRLGSISYYDCNIDGEALLETFKRNMAQRSQRHVILVFSDGLPNDCECRHQLLYRNLTDTISLCRRNGAEVYAFGIGTNDPEKFYGKENFVYLQSVDEMTSAFFHKTAEIITCGGRK